MERPNRDVFDCMGIRVRLKKPDDFLKVKETLTRIGTVGEEPNVLIQQCYILHKRGQYAIMHHSELEAMDGIVDPETLDQDALDMRNLIGCLLAEWGLLELLDYVERPTTMCGVKVVPYRSKSAWRLVSPYTIGRPSRAA